MLNVKGLFRVYSYLVLNPEKHCIDCRDLTDEGLVGCERCRYNKDNQIECYECQRKNSDYNYDIYDPYAFVTNTFRCYNNTDKTKPEFYGCLESYKNGDKFSGQMTKGEVDSYGIYEGSNGLTFEGDFIKKDGFIFF